MKLNVSLIRDALKCPQMAHNRHVLRRVPERTSTALEVGTLFHEGMQRRMQGKTGLWVELPSWLSVSPDARQEFEKHMLWLPIGAFAIPPEWDVVGVEQVFERQISATLSLQGRLDGYVVWNGKAWSVQWKTYTDDLLSLQESVRLSYHEVGYQWLAEQALPIPWGGTILGACQKLPGYRMIDGKKRAIYDEDRIAAFTVHYLTRPRAVQERMVGDLLHWAKRAMGELAVEYPARNYDQCWGPFRKSRCPYFAVCHEKEDLLGEKFVTAEPRYEEG